MVLLEICEKVESLCCAVAPTRLSHNRMWRQRRPGLLGRLDMWKEKRHGCISEITSAQCTGPRGRGAYAHQPSCDLHTSAAAWFWLPAQQSSSCPTDVATGIPPRLTQSHASAPSFFPWLFSHNGRSGLIWLSIGVRLIVFLTIKPSQKQKGSRVTFLSACSHFPSLLFSSSRFKLGASQLPAKIHRNQTARPRIHFCPSNAHRYWTAPFSPFALANTFLAGPLFFSSFAHLRLHHPMGHSRNH